jgi:hypothetical protein
MHGDDMGKSHTPDVDDRRAKPDWLNDKEDNAETPSRGNAYPPHTIGPLPSNKARQRSENEREVEPRQKHNKPKTEREEREPREKSKASEKGRPQNERPQEPHQRNRAREYGSQSDRPNEDRGNIAPSNDYQTDRPTEDMRNIAPGNGYQTDRPREDRRNIAPTNDYQTDRPREDRRNIAPSNGHQLTDREKHDLIEMLKEMIDLSREKVEIKLLEKLPENLLTETTP